MRLDLKKFIWLFTFLFIINVNSQSYFETYQNIIKNNKPSEITKTVDSLISICYSKKLFEEKIKIAHSFSLALNNNYHPDLAIKYGLIDVYGYENDLKLSNTKYSNAIFNLGLFYKENKNLTLAISNFKKVITLNNYPKKVGQAYCQMGSCFNIIGDLYKSVNYYKKGLKILKKEKPFLFVINALDLAWVYEQINTSSSLGSKIKLLKETEQLSTTTTLRTNDYLALYKEIANYYDNDDLFNFKESKKYYQKCLNLLLQNQSTDNLGAIYTSIGNLYTYVSKDSALYFLKKGLDFSKKKNVIARNYNITSKYYLINNQPEKAIESSNSSLKASLNLLTNSTNLDTINLLEQSIDKDVTIWALINKSDALIQQYYKTNPSLKLIEDALYNLNKADELITAINTIEFEEESQLFWQEEATKVYANAVICSHLLNKPDLAFNFIEKSKTLLLNQAILRNISKFQLPETQNLKRFEFKKRILDLEHKLNIAKKNNVKSIIQDSLFNIEYTFEIFKDSLKKAYPKYQTINKQIKPITITNLQSELDSNAIVIAYSIPNKKAIFQKIGIIAITKNDSQSYLIENTNELKELTTRFKTQISQPLNSNENLKTYQQTAYKLYKQLLPNGLASKLDKRHVIIIPDEDLQSIPFEALITNENSLDFLITKCMISYAYSITSLINNNSIKRNPKNNLTSFAPVTFKNKKLTSLNYSNNEIKNIIDITSGVNFINENATKANFLKNSYDSKIIHLATHANASNNPWIAFYDKKLQLHELYTYENQADLVVLSACNTSLGKNIKGEGVLSLARGFFYSGAKSVVSTLWNVNDKSTSFIMTDFYKNLKKGESKVKALHNAKLNYINTHSLSDKSPYYWASFTLIGDTGKINFSNNTSIYIMILGLALLLFLILLFKRIKK